MSFVCELSQLSLIAIGAKMVFYKRKPGDGRKPMDPLKVFEGIAWKWQSVDGSMVKALLAQEAVGPNPTDREKTGSERQLLVDELSVPLSLIVTGANRHDISRRTAVLDVLVLAQLTKDKPHLYADKGYDGQPAPK